MVKVPFIIGDGSDPIDIEVSYIARFPRDENSECAFCHGDWESDETTLIGAYFARNPDAPTCPCCDGQTA